MRLLLFRIKSEPIKIKKNITLFCFYTWRNNFPSCVYFCVYPYIIGMILSRKRCQMFAWSKTELNISYKEFSVSVASWVANQIKTYIILNLNYEILWKPKFWFLKLSNFLQLSKFSISVKFSLISLLCSKYFVQDCRSHLRNLKSLEHQASI